MIRVKVTDTCPTCGRQIDFTRHKNSGSKRIVCPECGEEYVYGITALTTFYTNKVQIIKYREEGLPHLYAGNTYYYPVRLCQKWFRGEEIEQEAAS